MNIYEYIKNAIITGQYPPNMRLTEEALAKELNVSRTPIRDAIKQLTVEGLLSPLKQGVSVRSFTKNDIRQIYDLRSMLEGYATGQAACYRNEADIKKLIAANNLYNEVIKKREFTKDFDYIYNVLNANSLFHGAILTAANNEHLHFHINKVTVLPIVFRSFYWFNELKLQQSFEVHETILEAIQKKEAERAKIAMQEHIYQARDYALKNWDKINAELLNQFHNAHF